MMVMQVHDYSGFDKKMLALIEVGTNMAASLSSAMSEEAKPFLNRPGEEFRVVDRRLQVLRKKGVIAWARRGSFVVWSLVKLTGENRP